MEPDAEDDPFAAAAAEFQAAIQNYQAETTKQGADIAPSPVASTPIPTSPVQSSGPAPIPDPIQDKQRTVVEDTTPLSTPSQNQVFPGTMPTGQPVPVMLAGQTQTPTMIPMGGHGGMAMGVPPTTNAVLALVLGIIGWVLSPICLGICTSLPAFFIAQSAIKTASAYPNHPDQGMANAAKWVALINVIVYVLGILFYVVMFGVLAANGDFDDGI
ncbi:MAG TPA: hypothetical protein QF555_01050 [Candidatus Thalassarchaeaceae archaeon]|nr:hypothetical protein [Candidatus Thalassarchaeaceae archaeon]